MRFLFIAASLSYRVGDGSSAVLEEGQKMEPHYGRLFYKHVA